MSELKDLSVLLTRPEHQTEELRQLIQKGGGNPVPFAVTKIIPMDGNHLLEPLFRDKISKTDLAIFVSPNAVTFGIKLLEKHALALPSDCKILAVGPGTAKLIKHNRLKVHDYPKAHFNSEALLALPSLDQIEGKHVLMVRGLGGREKIARELLIRKAIVCHLPCYERLPSKDLDTSVLDTFCREEKPAIVFTSVSAVDHFLLLNSAKNLMSTPSLFVVVSSNRIATHCASLGFKGQVIVAENAGAHATLAALERVVVATSVNNGIKNHA